MPKEGRGCKVQTKTETRRHQLLTKSKPVDCICRDVGAEGRPLVAGVLLNTLEAGGTGELGGVVILFLLCVNSAARNCRN